jgi:hypothetical protein
MPLLEILIIFPVSLFLVMAYFTTTNSLFWIGKFGTLTAKVRTIGFTCWFIVQRYFIDISSGGLALLMF